MKKCDVHQKLGAQYLDLSPTKSSYLPHCHSHHPSPPPSEATTPNAKSSAQTSSLTIKHDPDLAFIFISKVIKARRDHGLQLRGAVEWRRRRRRRRRRRGPGWKWGNGGQNNNNATNNLKQHTTTNLDTNARTNHHYANPATTAHTQTTTNANHTTSTTTHTHTHANHTATLFLKPIGHSSSSSISSTDILNEEYNIRSREDELLRKDSPNVLHVK
ncbi:hypothetical protein D9757_007250 [Collybiopsis confluens]|uniref:Uncharacterized protein n=1 Tax=Collybiopsis confluens TaxID=2823264 RepID=A0A8H5M6T3_9AGAR|nr:hypothetical protein D9757_007250 [Collybiopsis confluens]